MSMALGGTKPSMLVDYERGATRYSTIWLEDDPGKDHFRIEDNPEVMLISTPMRAYLPRKTSDCSKK